jgi:hypothetical protein
MTIYLLSLLSSNNNTQIINYFYLMLYCLKNHLLSPYLNLLHSYHNHYSQIILKTTHLLNINDSSPMSEPSYPHSIYKITTITVSSVILTIPYSNLKYSSIKTINIFELQTKPTSFYPHKISSHSNPNLLTL